MRCPIAFLKVKIQIGFFKVHREFSSKFSFENELLELWIISEIFLVCLQHYCRISRKYFILLNLSNNHHGIQIFLNFFFIENLVIPEYVSKNRWSLYLRNNKRCYHNSELICFRFIVAWDISFWNFEWVEGQTCSNFLNSINNEN